MEAGVDFKINNVEFENVKTTASEECDPVHGSPALKDDIKERLNEAASLFNDALLDEQKKQIDTQAAKITAYKKQFAHISKVLHKKNLMIEKLHKDIKDKDAVLSDVAEECRLSKVRNEELVASIKKYQKENEELRKKLATIVVNNVDAQALKSAESALGYKEKVISELKKKLAEKDKDIKALKLQISAWEKKNPHDGDGKPTPEEPKKPYPTEGNPEEIEIEDAVKVIRKAMKKGKTVIIESEPDEPIFKSMPSDFQKFVDEHFWELV